jgi:excisionase family DNA binding protein
MARKSPPVYAPVVPPPAGELSPEELARDGAMSIRDACRFLGVKKGMLRQLVREGKLRTVKVGKLRQFLRAGLRRYLAELIREQAQGGAA